jgi:hypothetical protein
MHQIKNLFTISLLLLMFACIKPYTPVIEGNAANKMVVSGKISDVEGWQEVDISMSSPVQNPQHIPVSDCIVNILDDKGNIFSLPEDNPGTYRAWIEQEYLAPGTAYKVNVYTSEGETIESSYDTLLAGAPLDSVYYIIEDVPTSDPDIFIRGLQFYVDLNATEFACRNYRWEISQTWELHAEHPKEYYYDGRMHQIIPPDYRYMICWVTSQVKAVYTLSTKTLNQNAFHQYPLHFVDGQSTARLGILYSILVSQQSLSENAYKFWEQVRINSEGFGGLYEKQPLAIKGNLLNLTSPDKEVLGYFYATSQTSRRYFYKDIEGLELNFSDHCNESPLGAMGWAEFSKLNYPVYFLYTTEGELRTLNIECVDCRKMGGSTTKPDFWPE